jgi:hypothetical protein
MSEHISMPTDNDPYPTDPHNAKNETQLPEYTQLARLGRTSWQRQVAAIATILFFWLVLGAAAALAVMGLAPGGYDLAAPSPTAYIAINVSPLAMLAEVAVAVRFIHQRPLRTLITPSRRIDWRRIACAFALMVTLAAASSALEAALYPGTYHLTSQPRQWLTMLPVILILTTLQPAPRNCSSAATSCKPSDFAPAAPGCLSVSARWCSGRCTWPTRRSAPARR